MEPSSAWLHERARELRKNPTPMERKLWRSLRACRTGAWFKRQRVLAPCIVDFYAESHRLAVEVDGPIHDAYITDDEQRDAVLLERHGVRTLRFTNHDVRWNLRVVEAQIRHAIRRTRPTPSSNDHPSSTDTPP